MSSAPIKICSVSWIDGASLPKIGFWKAAEAAISWPNKVAIGLVATANPAPPKSINDVKAFQKTKQYRALTACTYNASLSPSVKSPVIDPGWTPPVDKKKIDTWVRHLMPLGDDPKFYAGEASAISKIVEGKLHPNTTLLVPAQAQILVSGLIKFRAGAHTDKIGIDKAGSPVHVPWVWSEWVLFKMDGTYQFGCGGSRFPSHAWYINGQRVATMMQLQIKVSEKEKAISTGRPAGQPRSDAGSDKQKGIVTKDKFAIDAGKPQFMEVSKFI